MSFNHNPYSTVRRTIAIGADSNTQLMRRVNAILADIRSIAGSKTVVKSLHHVTAMLDGYVVTFETEHSWDNEKDIIDRIESCIYRSGDDLSVWQRVPDLDKDPCKYIRMKFIEGPVFTINGHTVADSLNGWYKTGAAA